MEFNIREAKAKFFKLLEQIALGEEVIIAKDGVPIAKLVPLTPAQGKRPLGFLRGQIWMADDFNAPLPDEILAGFYGEDSAERKPVKRVSIIPTVLLALANRSSSHYPI